MGRISLLVVAAFLGIILVQLGDLAYKGWRKFILWFYSKFY